MITILWQSQLSLTWPKGPGFLCSIKENDRLEMVKEAIKASDDLKEIEELLLQ